MAATFERGSPDRPRGHALCFFRAIGNEAVHATYIIVSPVAFDIGKYLPPILAGQVSQFDIAPFAAVALPPIPEETGSEAELRALAEARDDDLLDGGALPAGGPAAALPAVQELVQWYRGLYEKAVATIEPAASAGQHELEIDADEVLYSVLGNRERLTELAKLAGSLRYGLEVHDGAMVSAAEERMRKIGRFLPGNFNIDRLIEAATEPGERGRRLTDLYLKRCFKLVEEDYAAVGEIEREIASSS